MTYALLSFTKPTRLDPAALGALGAGYIALSQEISDSGEMVGGDLFEEQTLLRRSGSSMPGLQRRPVRHEIVNTHRSLLYWEPMRRYFQPAAAHAA